MKRSGTNIRFRSTIVLLLFLSLTLRVSAWGFWAHQRINRIAVFTLPPEMMGFYKAHIEYLSEHAVDPDERRYAVDFEAPRHFIDVDHYGHYPFEMVPRKWMDAVEKYSEDTLLAYGIVPWHVNSMLYQLTNAFKDKDLERILKLSAEIGHYVADANVPLHTTENYNGQLTGQKGIHGLWESRLPELYAEEYDFFIGPAAVIEDPLAEAWAMVLESHAALDSVLKYEKQLSKKFDSDRKYSYENRNNLLVKVYSEEFCRAYHHLLNGQVERRMRSSIFRVGSFWYTAWVNAGQPDLAELTAQPTPGKKEKYKKKLFFLDREKQDLEIGMGPVPYPVVEEHVCCHHH